MRFRAYLASSLDGFVATPDGDVGWLSPYDSEKYGYREFIAEIGAIVMGRVTFDQVRGMGEWPYAEQRVHVLTTRPLRNPPRGTTGWSDPAALVTHLRGEPSSRDVWVAGGPRTLSAMRGLLAVDSWELFVIPVLLGDGIPLFSREAQPTPLRLRRHQAFPDGVVALIYERG